MMYGVAYSRYAVPNNAWNRVSTGRLKALHSI